MPSLTYADAVSKDAPPTKGKSEGEGDQSEEDDDNEDDAEESAFVIGGR